MIEYLGTTIYRRSDGFRRTYHLWGTIGTNGDLYGLHYGISHDFRTAHGELSRQQCDTNFQQLLFRVAEERWERERLIDQSEDEPVLIDEEDQFGAGPCH